MAIEHRNALPPGYELEDYRIESILGHGGFGITYKARDIALDREAAIKEYLPAGFSTRDPNTSSVHPTGPNDTEDFEWGLERFRQEARTLVSFRHPNIVKVIRFFEANNTAYLVMEYERGDSLAAILSRDKTLPEEEVLEFLYPLMDGLERVHRAGFLHRDIKPENIFIRTDGTPVLLDFGSARQALGTHSQTLTSIVSGGYAPFEQYYADSRQGPYSDIYSLGATLYRTVTGEKPTEATARVRDDPNIPASTASRGLYSESLLKAIDACLAVHEQDRPQTIGELRTLLEGGTLAERPHETPPPPVEPVTVAQAATPAPPPPPAEAKTVSGAKAAPPQAPPPVPLAASENDVTRRKAGADDMPTQARRSTPGAPPPPADTVPPGAYAGGSPPAKGGLSTGVIIAIVAGVVMIAAAATAGFILFADPTKTETAKTEQSRQDAERRAREAREAEERRAAEEARRKEAEARRKGSAEAQRREAERKRRAEEERKRQAEANRRRGSTSGEEDDGDSGPQPGTTAPRRPQQSAKLTISSFRIRNRCNYPVRAMIHIKDPQRDWTTFGWVSIGAGQLTREFPTRNRHVYYYGVSLNGQVIFNRGNQGNPQRLLRWQGQQYRVGHVNMGPKFIRWTVNFC